MIRIISFPIGVRIKIKQKNNWVVWIWGREDLTDRSGVGDNFDTAGDFDVAAASEKI